MRTIVLNATSAGMTRLRTKGGASPESLYELYNGYVNASKIPRARPPAVWKFQVADKSKGLVWFKGTFYTFSAHVATAVAGSTNRVLIHPVVGYAGEIKQIHFAQPFMGCLFVTAEFTADGATPAGIYHYWLTDPPVWQGNHIYKDNELVSPSVPNGLYYKASLQKPPVSWQPLTSYRTNDSVQPSTYNGFMYVATFLQPTSPTTSTDTEPVWPTTEYATVIESSSGPTTTSQPPEPPAPPPSQPPGTDPGGRYGNPGGSGIKSSLINPIRPN